MPKLHCSIPSLGGLLIALSAAISSADTSVATPIAGMQPMPKFPPSSTVLQTAVNGLNQCIDNTLSASADSQTATTTDAVMGQCAQAQAQLQQMLPAALYDKSVTDARQRITNSLAARQQTNATP